MKFFVDDDYQARKAERKAHYEKSVKGWKEVPCGACSGSGYYDYANPHTGRVPKCGACNGTGKERVSPEEYLELEKRLEK